VAGRKMNQNFVTLTPLTVMLGIFIIVILVIRSKTTKNQNSNLYPANRGYRVLCKSQSNRVFAGVCGGIAEHFGWDALVVRLFFLFTGVGLFTYVVLAIVIPESPSKLL
jgi:phage shock protein C